MSEPSKPDPVRGFFGAALIAVGVLMMLLCGGCGALVFIFYFEDGVSHPNDLPMLMFPVVLGGVPALIGWGLFVVGRGLRKVRPQEPPAP